MNLPVFAYYVAPNSTNYKTNSGMATFAPGGGPLQLGKLNPSNNATVFALNAATGQMVWTHFIPNQGYRGGNTVSGNVVFITLSSGDLLMLDARTGNTIKDLFIGGPLNVLPSIGATTSGQMEVIFPITAGILSWGTGVPGDIVALTLQNVLPATTNTVTTSVTVSGPAATTTSVTTVTASSGGVDTTTAYGIAAVAVIFIIATGYLAMRGRKPAS
jgi:glucose dehydrogenase